MLLRVTSISGKIFVRVYGKIRNCLRKLIVEACASNNFRTLCVECNMLFTLYCYSVVSLLQSGYGLVRYGYIGVRCLHFTVIYMLCYGLLFMLQQYRM